MAGVKPIDDICWELFGGPCPVYGTLEEMKACDRGITHCGEFITAFRAALPKQEAAPAPAAPAPAAPAPKKK